jgi:hypothetical protein
MTPAHKLIQTNTSLFSLTTSVNSGSSNHVHWLLVWLSRRCECWNTPKEYKLKAQAQGYEETYESEENGSGLEAPDALNNAHRIPPVALHGRLGDALTHDSAFVG